MRLKPTRYLSRTGLLLLALLISGAALAAGDVYDLEIVIFERPGNDRSEYWPPDPGEPDRGSAIGRLDAGGATGPATLLPAGARTLGPSAYTLKQKGMIVHEHLAWRQATQGRNSNSWFWVGGGRLSGLIRVTQGRYLHLDTDLLLRDSGSEQPYRIQLHRRMRSGELHYVDHPKLGILVQAERYRPADGASGAPDAPSGEPKPAAPQGTARPG